MCAAVESLLQQPLKHETAHLLVLSERRCVNDETELHITRHDSLVGGIHLVDAHLLDHRAQAVLSTKVQHLLGFRDAADIVTREHLAAAD